MDRPLPLCIIPKNSREPVALGRASSGDRGEARLGRREAARVGYAGFLPGSALGRGGRPARGGADAGYMLAVTRRDGEVEEE